ncbi:MAG: PhzF family phenazine biosynthesis protein [Vicinamibacterales bacterium]|mgnify:CR=1 FL=1|jgi:trans-2,3-dihydro-3-hydroxyanthranilate isomerase|nr:phenazine biosynthesis protein PhzF [Acidobacteriota bacterium]MDP7470791.1 PhzF family phenazine biosynthesis protein [Vicinamibacterales bacterium]MDP7670434.1 PhzF family phenazine biosynthesis protein [Vicinamibacterales bacterium]HJO38092.1 PhzF family phenazine biosynthesis protein [Vicinamibacterales bacterium]
MTAYRYLHLDVFTNRRFAGNQLAVFPAAAGLDPSVMQQIAAEMAYSETTFILPAEAGGDARMRIFTPAVELPIAGHPTVGSIYALAHDGVIQVGQERFMFELGVGPTPVTLEWDGSRLESAWMRQQPPRFGAPVTRRDGLGEALGIDAAEIVDALPVQPVSCGVEFLMVPVATRSALDGARSDTSALDGYFATADLSTLPVYLFTTERGDDDAVAYSRMFAPSFGIAEDPATGSASGPLGAYLVEHAVVPADQSDRMLNLQGVKMGRPSEIWMSIERTAGGTMEVRVGGSAIMVSEGTLTA